jgi:hypothetical protein
LWCICLKADLELCLQLHESSESWDSAKQDLQAKLQIALREGVELLETVHLLEEKIKDAESTQLSILNEVRNDWFRTSKGILVC